MGKNAWALSTAKDVANALEWIRQRTEGKTLVLVAIGRGGIAFSKHSEVTPTEAMELLEEELGNIKQGLERMEAEGQRCGARGRREY